MRKGRAQSTAVVPAKLVKAAVNINDFPTVRIKKRRVKSLPTVPSWEFNVAHIDDKKIFDAEDDNIFGNIAVDVESIKVVQSLKDSTKTLDVTNISSPRKVKSSKSKDLSSGKSKKRGQPKTPSGTTSGKKAKKSSLKFKVTGKDEESQKSNSKTDGGSSEVHSSSSPPRSPSPTHDSPHDSTSPSAIPKDVFKSSWRSSAPRQKPREGFLGGQRNSVKGLGSLGGGVGLGIGGGLGGGLGGGSDADMSRSIDSNADNKLGIRAVASLIGSNTTHFASPSTTTTTTTESPKGISRNVSMPVLSLNHHHSSSSDSPASPPLSPTTPKSDRSSSSTTKKDKISVRSTSFKNLLQRGESKSNLEALNNHTNSGNAFQDMPEPDYSLYTDTESSDILWETDEKKSIRGVSSQQCFNFFIDNNNNNNNNKKNSEQWIKIVILIHEHFSTTVEILRSLKNILSNTNIESIFQTIKNWLIYNPHSLFKSETEIIALQSLIGLFDEKDREQLHTMIHEYKQLIEGTPSSSLSSSNGSLVNPKAPKPMLTKKKPGKPDFDGYSILDFHPTEIARQLTLIDHKLFSAVPPHEFLLKNFMDPAKSPKLAAMSERFNTITAWIGTEITSEPKLKLRQKLVSHFIIVGVKLLSLRNFAGLMAVFIGLTQSPVSRMHQTWGGISEEYLDKWQKLESLCSPLSNFKNLRTLHENPTVPSIKAPTLFLKDLTFIEDGNDSYLSVEQQQQQQQEGGSSSENKKYFNFSKMQQIGKLLDRIQNSQKAPYDLYPVPILQEFLLTVKFQDRNTLDKNSRLYEPPLAE
eukprot:TRINITY_DN849_c2_g1_i2.p1 TRINITY_DN849_c2_g1~~TRINITY_DN849_c2_g1_i2.p1  ORF type:complete len:807 (+),score=235.11 TRINITY_DN849_c2_g1_i2:2091-4511(+)